MSEKPDDAIRNTEQWEQAKEDLDTKDLLMRIAFGIDELNRQVQALRAEQNGESPTPETETTYRCIGCSDEIAESNLESHARTCMNWSEEMGDILDVYSQSG